MDLSEDKKKSLIRTTLIVLILFCSLLLLSRDLFCHCEEFLFWVSDPNSSHTSQHLFDPYSFSHFQHGLIFFFLLYWMKIPRIEWAVLIESLWEFAENTPMVINRYRTATIALGYTGDSITNSMFDVFCCACGFYVARRIPWKYTLAIYLFIEVFMLFVYRDSLILNVIMLLFPLDIIKEWQQA